MRKRNVVILVAAIVVIVLIVGGYILLHLPPKTATVSSVKTSSSTSIAIIQTKSASNVGSYLADANGDALYTYGQDTTGVSNCTGACTYAWPVYQADSSATLPTNVTVITRSDGVKQYAYKGLPLYTFTSDTSGNVTGDGASGFHVAKP